jgi:hypothetical protein
MFASSNPQIRFKISQDNKFSLDYKLNWQPVDEFLAWPGTID